MRSAILAAVASLTAACQDSDVSRQVGARCDVDADCDERCLAPSSQAPGGFCTIACADRGECPGDTTCADRQGDGICLFTCASDTDCTFLGTGWGCTSVDLHGGGIKVQVCTGE